MEPSTAERPVPSPETTPPPPLAVLLGQPEPSDSRPTIISKNLPAVRSERGLAESLRGRCLAHFELIEPIGVGGMAAVILARDTQLDRTVALKVLPPEMATDPENVRRFHQEARAAAKLDHENVARVYYCGQDQGLLFIAFEFVEGQNLRTLLERRGRLPVPEAIHYVLQVATGLAHASERGVVHRDIKPSNIIITPSGRAKLVDMGLARSLGPQPDGALTQSGVTLGTFDYISPEQAMEPRDADVRSDIYSLGCTLYHMLTGQPPVPEGTAAKKLHCHQHVPPVDPRQLNPAIPDEVAATLARMMAKDPSERYQRPEQLVQHLLVLAQNVGAPAGGPGGVLFVDAPLPSPPQMRPAFLMAAAVVVLVSFIVFLGTAPTPPSNGRSQVVRNAPKPGGEPAPASENAFPTKPGPGQGANRTEEPPPAPTPSPPPWYTPENVKDLADYLDNHDWARVALAKDLDLKGLPLTFAGRSLEIKTLDPRLRPTIRLDYPASRGGRWAALTIRGDCRVTLTGLRFVVNATAADIQMAAIAHEGVGLVTATGCEFVPMNPADPAGGGRLSSVRVSGPRGEGELPRLNLVRCYFGPGQEAVTLTGAAEIDAAECAFAPHSTALFHLRGRGNQDSKLTLNHCSAFLLDGAVFRLADGPACKLNVYKSIFSRPESDSARPLGAALVLQTGQFAREFEYGGNENCYHNLKLYWMKATDGASAPEMITTLKDFDLKKHVQVGELSVELADSPWEAREPLALLAKSPQKAFRLKADLPQLRRGEDLAQMVGVNISAWGGLYDGLARPEEKKPDPVAGRRYVDPSTPDPAKGVYATLREAVAGARSGDEIRIKVNGRLRVEPLRFEDPNFALTIQAEAGYHPVLSLSRSREPDASLFLLYEGQLTLKDLGLLLEPVQDGLRHQSVVTVAGPGRCLLQNCLVTLRGGEGLHLAAVTLADPGATMKMDSRSPRTLPDVDIANCFVRGDGDLLAVRSSRPLDLEVRNSLVVLRNGSLLNVEGAADDVSGQPALQLVALSQVTAYLGDHLAALRAGRHPRGLVKTDVTAVDCLFAAANGKSLIHLEGMDSDEQAAKLLSWHSKREQPNVYSGFSPMLDQSPRNEDMMLMPFDRDRWRTFAGEADEARFKRVQFSAAPTADEPWAKVLAAHFRPKPDADLPRTGADIDELVKRFDDGPAGAASGNE